MKKYTRLTNNKAYVRYTNSVYAKAKAPAFVIERDDDGWEGVRSICMVPWNLSPGTEIEVAWGSETRNGQELAKTKVVEFRGYL